MQHWCWGEHGGPPQATWATLWDPPQATLATAWDPPRPPGPPRGTPPGHLGHPMGPPGHLSHPVGHPRAGHLGHRVGPKQAQSRRTLLQTQCVCALCSRPTSGSWIPDHGSWVMDHGSWVAHIEIPGGQQCGTGRSTACWGAGAAPLLLLPLQHCPSGLRVGPLTSPLGGRREWTEGRRTFVLGTLSKRGRGWLKKEKLIGLIIITIVLTII